MNRQNSLEQVAAKIKAKLGEYPAGSRIEVTCWRGVDQFDLTPPHEREQRLFAEFRIRPPKKRK